MRNFYGLLITVLLLASCLLYAQEEAIAIALKTKGDIEINHSKETAKLKNGQLLYNNDELMSSDDSYAAIKFIDGGALLKLFPNSTLIINAIKKDGKLHKTNYLKSGKVYSKIMKKTGFYEIETPTAVASVKGTGFIVGLTPGGATDLDVLTGVVRLQNKMDGEFADVSKGKKARSTGKGEILVKDSGKDKLDKETKKILEDELKGDAIEFDAIGPNGEKRKVKIILE